VPAHTEGSGVSLPPPHQSLHAAATHNPELARSHTHTHTHTPRHPVKPLSQAHLFLILCGGQQ